MRNRRAQLLFPTGFGGQKMDTYMEPPTRHPMGVWEQPGMPG